MIPSPFHPPTSPSFHLLCSPILDQEWQARGIAPVTCLPVPAVPLVRSISCHAQDASDLTELESCIFQDWFLHRFKCQLGGCSLGKCWSMAVMAEGLISSSINITATLPALSLPLTPTPSILTSCVSIGGS